MEIKEEKIAKNFKTFVCGRFNITILKYWNLQQIVIYIFKIIWEKIT